MPAQKMYDTISDSDGDRLHVEKEGITTHIPYSNGAEITMEKTGEAVTSESGRPIMREVRTITKAKAPQKYFVGGFGPGRWAEMREGRDG